MLRTSSSPRFTVAVYANRFATGCVNADVRPLDAVPVVNLIGLTSEAESRILLSYEGSLQPYLDGAGPVVPVTSFVGS